MVDKLTKTNRDFLSYPTIDLLDEYGSGNAVPGSGSASALSALVAVEMLRTVCKLTCRKDQYFAVHEQFVHIEKELTVYKEKLIQLFNNDILEFGKVYQIKVDKMVATGANKKKLAAEEIEALKKATTIPLQLATICLEILALAHVAFDDGYKTVRGDSGVGISNLLSATSSSLFVIFLNLKSFKKVRSSENVKWRRETYSLAEQLFLKYQLAQTQSFQKVSELYKEGLKPTDIQKAFPFQLQEGK